MSMQFTLLQRLFGPRPDGSMSTVISVVGALTQVSAEFHAQSSSPRRSIMKVICHINHVRSNENRKATPSRFANYQSSAYQATRAGTTFSREVFFFSFPYSTVLRDCCLFSACLPAGTNDIYCVLAQANACGVRKPLSENHAFPVSLLEQNPRMRFRLLGDSVNQRISNPRIQSMK